MQRVRSDGGDLVSLRRRNSLTTLAVLREREAATLAELVTATGLARASLVEVVDDLSKLGWVATVAPEPGTIGRPARRYRFRAEAGHVLGLDLGINTIRATVADLNGAPLAARSRKLAAAGSKRQRLAGVDALVGQCLAEAGIGAADIWAAGVGTTGIVDGGVVTLSGAAPDWTGVDLSAHFARNLPAPAIVENDSKLAALAECRRGVAVDVADLVFAHAGRRIGAASVIAGELRRGYGGTAGEVGFLPGIDLGAISARLESPRLLPAGTDPADAAIAVFAAARDGQRAALQSVRRYAADLARVMAPLVVAIDPQLVVLGGGFSRAADLLLAPFTETLGTMCARTPEVRGSELGEECVTVGAVCVALDHIDLTLLAPGSGPLPAAKPPAQH